MTIELYIALATFAFVSVITPGPNNLMLMASGANFGFRRTLPHMAGVCLGLPIMILPVGLGIMRLFEVVPGLYTLLKLASVLYLLWLAAKIATAAPPSAAQADGRPLTFLQAVAFQWVNPKAWSMALGAITLYATGRDLQAILWVAGTFVLVGCISTTTWTGLGTALQGVLARPGRLQVFNVCMALLLVASMALVLLR